MSKLILIALFVVAPPAAALLLGILVVTPAEETPWSPFGGWALEEARGWSSACPLTFVLVLIEEWRERLLFSARNS